MTTNEALEWLYKQLKQKRIALGNAERKPNASAEIDDIKAAIDAIEWIIGVVLEQDTECTAVEESHTDTKIERVVEMLKAKYERAKKMDYVRNPVAYALHQVWKAADRDSETEVGRENKRSSQPHHMCNRCGNLFEENQLVHERWFGYYCWSCYNEMHGATAGLNGNLKNGM